jgi:hypothetical protein
MGTLARLSKPRRAGVPIVLLEDVPQRKTGLLALSQETGVTIGVDPSASTVLELIDRELGHFFDDQRLLDRVAC